LIRSHPDFKPARAGLLRDCFALQQPVAHVVERIRYHDRAATRINEITGQNLDPRELVLFILHDLGADLGAITDAQLSDFFDHMRALVRRFPPRLIDAGLPRVLADCRAAGLSISLLSNTGFLVGKVLDDVMELLGLLDLLDFRVYSDEINASKPHRSAFAAVLTELNKLYPAIAEDILHVGDNQQADFFGAQASGLRALWLQPSGAGDFRRALRPLIPALPEA